MKKNIELKILTITVIILLLVTIIVILQHYKKSEVQNDEIREIVGYLSIDRLNLYDIEVFDNTNLSQSHKGIERYFNDESEKYNGNICLLNYNEDEKNDCLKNIKELQVGDSILYKTGNEINEYAVYSIDLIYDSEQRYLNSSEEDIITIVTKAGKSNMNVIVRGYKIKKSNSRKEL